MPEAGLASEVAAIAAEAGRLAMTRWETEFKRWEKVPGSPVCDVDLELDALLRDRLTALLPEAGWLSEETADSRARLDARRIWVVDPIDGTRDYLRHRPGWSVSVALVEDGAPVIGVLDAPARGERWIAEAGRGAARNGVQLHVTPRDQLAGSRMPTDHLPKVDGDLVIVDKPNSIALRIAMVAAGEADLLATIRWGNEWDVAAAVLLVREAGGVITDVLGQELVFNTPSAKAFGLLVSAPGIHDAAVERLAHRAREALES
ncbi:myo-inositol-1(or 4)-monophosphatase [Sphingomonas kyeonggiensis]|uniref:Myo-inositol-1(Or 4)-monophosphatase n=1 Tax=Sphingomonas kyeonggiensis TaxID=1268553 RepID=A0A7W7JZY6_9SPHN|nr:3'(2'),5'-bisphosphate nucleotidase CysQ [Sphingomonas kyeonggiensis]MBB4838389.1 myo-inositol-1(or 4)-monophosphatase [Sphingomonas kyeonggiensis]